YMTNFTLRELEERLDPEIFFRAHKSRLVNLKHVRAIVPWFGGRFKLVMRDQKGSEVELSRAQAREVPGGMHWGGEVSSFKLQAASRTSLFAVSGWDLKAAWRLKVGGCSLLGT